MYSLLILGKIISYTFLAKKPKIGYKIPTQEDPLVYGLLKFVERPSQRVLVSSGAVFKNLWAVGYPSNQACPAICLSVFPH